ncbi:hypothetical protein J5N97_017864 [Dioscorea zingiberensis]|uniref:S-acyltransferase n=1 Tax=Dioscorea zingiberensis TaxID=325984 RepID=A0A9D5CMU3_9LILI|nr:hypothetical protein J5N97_017864 [Dioscorea zingiberensis]
MVRRHGCQLPVNVFQVVAITVFFLLVIVFYAFFAPFLGKKIFECAAIAVYTPVAIAVFILYARCTHVDPADPGIMKIFEEVFDEIPNTNGNLSLQNNNPPANFDNVGGEMCSPSSAFSHSLDGSCKRVSVGDDRKMYLPITPGRKSSLICFHLGGLICFLFAKDDCRKEDANEQHAHAEDALFCTLCNAEVRKFSKHCKSCDKCVDGFDHHCRWLNNCVGRRNYITFISLMVTSLIWLLFEFGIGITVLVLCFVNKTSTEKSIIEKLGHGFSHPLFATIVAICTAISLLACAPLGELLFFHMILIKKGMTTYEYVVAMRAMSEAQPAFSDDEHQAGALDSPTNSATISGGSSFSLRYKGVWCTPPRVFVDQQDEIVPHLEPGMLPSSIDPDAAGNLENRNKSKKAVKISAWKLAKLDSNEVMRAAAKARASSSVLRPVESHRVPDAHLSLSGNSSVRSSTGTDYNTTKESKSRQKLSPLRNMSLTGKEDFESITSTASCLTSPIHIHEPVALIPLPLQCSLPEQTLLPRGPLPSTRSSNLMFQSSASLGKEGRRPLVVWDQEAGRYVSIPASSRVETSMQVPSRTSHVSLANPSAETCNHGRRPNVPSSSVAVPMQQPDRFLYTEQSIFFGGPLLNVLPGSNNRRNDGNSRLTRNQEGSYCDHEINEKQW